MYIVLHISEKKLDKIDTTINTTTATTSNNNNVYIRFSCRHKTTYVSIIQFSAILEVSITLKMKNF